MSMPLAPLRKPPSVPETIMARIQGLFVQGALRTGDQLPSERDLAEQLGVGRSSVRAALQGLQLMGLVEVRQGTGTFLTSEPGRWLMEPLKWTYSSHAQMFVELLEARLSVEVELARLAAERATLEDIETIRIAASRRAQAPVGQHIRTGFAFHQAVARAAHNHVLSFMMTAARQLYLDVLQDLEHSAHVLSAFDAVQVRGHERILEAIEAGDAEGAAAAMTAHLLELRDFYPQLATAGQRRVGRKGGRNRTAR
jgi:GntR family transcriptional regulator, transcriptional repressor for pyruvate dehydrogenase complex